MKIPGADKYRGFSDLIAKNINEILECRYKAGCLISALFLWASAC